MTPSEFKAWFDGFTEAFTGCPTKAQWARVKERVAEIDGKPVTERVYVDRYWQGVLPRTVYWGTAGSTAIGLCGGANTVQQYSEAKNGMNAVSCAYNSHDAMAVLGRADAQKLAS